MYKASFEVEHGVVTGLGKYDDKVTVEKEFPVSDEAEVLRQAFKHAKYLSMEYLSDTEGKTTVTVTLCRPDGSEIDQRELARKIYKGDKKEKLEEAIKREMPEGKTKVVSTWAEHVLAL